MSEESTIYLDNNATTAPAPEVCAAVAAALTEHYGNPSSTHAVGQVAKRVVAEARKDLGRLIGAGPAEIVFTSSATEANHQAILGALSLDPAKRHLVLSAVEHPSSLVLVRQLEAQGVHTTLVPVDGGGRLDLDALRDAIRDDTALVSVMWANNETGVLLPVEEAAAIARGRGVPFHTDAVQAVGRVTVDFAACGADLLSLSGHKLHAPKGVGALVVRKGLKWPPLIYGHQERTRRGGTENVPGIVGLGAAARLAFDSMSEDALRIGALRDRLEAGLLAALPEAVVAGNASPRLPNTLNIRFAALDSEPILDRLDKLGIYASSGSACTAAGTEPSHVLLAMGQTREQAAAALRLSLGRSTTAADIDRVLDVLPSIVRTRLPIERAA